MIALGPLNPKPQTLNLLFGGVGGACRSCEVDTDHMDCFTPDKGGKVPELITLVVEDRACGLGRVEG